MVDTESNEIEFEVEKDDFKIVDKNETVIDDGIINKNTF